MVLSRGQEPLFHRVSISSEVNSSRCAGPRSLGVVCLWMAHISLFLACLCFLFSSFYSYYSFCLTVFLSLCCFVFNTLLSLLCLPHLLWFFFIPPLCSLYFLQHQGVVIKRQLELMKTIKDNIETRAAQSHINPERTSNIINHIKQWNRQNIQNRIRIWFIGNAFVVAEMIPQLL